ncbi:MAG: hypothetical protein J6M53_09495 [Bacteroidaceae bacterium]|nr:hypothetical protein [Bacteroidaceae bacterium]
MPPRPLTFAYKKHKQQVPGNLGSWVLGGSAKPYKPKNARTKAHNPFQNPTSANAYITVTLPKYGSVLNFVVHLQAESARNGKEPVGGITKNLFNFDINFDEFLREAH